MASAGSLSALARLLAALLRSASLPLAVGRSVTVSAVAVGGWGGGGGVVPLGGLLRGVLWGVLGEVYSGSCCCWAGQQRCWCPEAAAAAPQCARRGRPLTN
jgi:hypothetical protein